jgi:predicted ArsR family transcriptional regulator
MHPRVGLSGTATHKALSAESRLALLGALEQAGRQLSADEAATLVGLHRNTIRVHLEQLVGAGLVERHTEDRSTPGRPRVLYGIAPGQSPSGEREWSSSGGTELGYRELARVLAAQLAQMDDAALLAERAGRNWASAVARASLPSGPVRADKAVGAVTDAMEMLGFRPVADDQRILLRSCPFADVAREHREVICSMHLGMLREAFETLGSDVAVENLAPFVQADPPLCVVNLAATPIDGAGRASPAGRQTGGTHSKSHGPRGVRRRG